MNEQKGALVGLDHLRLTDGYWKEKQELFRRVTLRAIYDRFDETGRFNSMKADWKEGMPGKPHIFWESDVAKWIEGAAYFLQKQPDPALEAQIDELVERMKAYQGEDGYLNVYFTVVEPQARFQRRTDHELYCAGHLMEAAVAYKQATGKTEFLQIMCRYADLIDRVFRVERSAAFETPGHEEIEYALFRLYEATGEERYRKLSEFFVDTRGTSPKDPTYSWADQEHMQSHLPVREQKTAEGHSVRALYLYRAMAALAAENRDEGLMQACRALFSNISGRRMYLTGGVGSTCRGESFSYDYNLPEVTAYAETCASIALALFCREMWLAEPDSAYADCAELALYNTVMAGVSLDGDKFFYENPLALVCARMAFNASRPEKLQEYLPIAQRVKMFDCSCCPPNLLRLVGSVEEFMYSTLGDTIYAHCYMAGRAEIPLGGRAVSLTQETAYPYDGDVRFTLHTAGTYAVALRIPNWCGGRYRISLNGEELSLRPEKGYVSVRREWREGDRLSLELPLEVQLVEADPHAWELCGRAAVMRGPLVFCAEASDQEEGVLLRDVRLSRGKPAQCGWQTIAGQRVPALSLEAAVRESRGTLYSSSALPERSVRLRLIPYSAWANREPSDMETWFLLR